MKLIRFFGAGVVSSLLCAGSVMAQVVSVVPASSTVNVGDTVTVKIDISGVNAGTVPAVGGFDFNFAFDPSLLSYQSASFGTQLDISGLGDIQTATPSSGSVNLFEVSLDSAADLTSLQAGSFTLATLSFTSLAAGSSALNVAINALSDANGSSLPATILQSSVSISAVPEPAAFAMLMAGIGVVGFVSLRQRVA